MIIIGLSFISDHDKGYSFAHFVAGMDRRISGELEVLRCEHQNEHSYLAG
jgi:hypothetical protein